MQGYNKYYPPEYDGKSSLNKLAGKHSLGNRARKLNQHILIVRFELPFDIWCEKCNNHIAQGTRYNAEKKKVGAYYTTPIFSFRMKCHLCPNYLEIQTDPQKTEYKVTSGARRKITEFDGDKIGAIKVDAMLHASNQVDDADSRDPFAGVEKSLEKTKQMRASHQRITELYQHTNQRWADPYEKNQILRRLFRNERKIKDAKLSANDSMEWRIAKVAQHKKRHANGPTSDNR
ncbi:CWC16 protein [Lipomyces chichibuensis]|uniref:CWC16 protein n=1 Tax=Lipomyces chichibuensis TaxID=1546026 RepID=UPI00334345ED